jgi:hypothetical protein
VTAVARSIGHDDKEVFDYRSEGRRPRIQSVNPARKRERHLHGSGSASTLRRSVKPRFTRGRPCSSMPLWGASRRRLRDPPPAGSVALYLGKLALLLGDHQSRADRPFFHGTNATYAHGWVGGVSIRVSRWP